MPEIVREHGGTPVRTRVGHSFIKGEMAETGAIFGGEHSGHFYFRDFWRADSGMLAALHVLAALGGQDRPLSELLAQYSAATSPPARSTPPSTTRPAGPPQSRPPSPTATGVEIDQLDGLTVELPDGSWFNVRPSNTEPLLRLNVEAADDKRDGRRCATRSSSSSADPGYTDYNVAGGVPVNLDPALLEILACPACHATLASTTRRQQLVCTGCGLAYPVRDDIPVLLVDEATRPGQPAADPNSS